MNGIQSVSTTLQFSLEPGMLVRNLSVALVCGILISRFYCWSSRSLNNNSKSFVASLITLTMITAVVILVIGNNLARAFGLVGAMSIIRFRTAVKDVQDIVFIFFSLAIGMAAGVGLPLIAFIGTIGIGIVILGISFVQSFSIKKRDYLLQFSYRPSDKKEAAYLRILEQYCSRYNLINMKVLDHDEHLELSFYIRLKEETARHGFIVALSHLEGVANANLFFDEE